MSRIWLSILIVAVVVAEAHKDLGKVGFCASTIRGATYDLTGASHNGYALPSLLDLAH